MKTKILNIPFLALMLAGLFAGITSCKKYNDWPVDDSHSRLFSPTSLEVTVDGVTPTFKWTVMPNVSNFIIEISQDSLRFTNIIDSFVVSPENGIINEGNTAKHVYAKLLSPLTQYSVRVKSINTGGDIASSLWSAGVAFKTKTEQLMLPATNVAPTSFTLNWLPNAVVTGFVIKNNKTGIETAYPISAAEKTAGTKDVTGLTPEVGYSITLMNGTNPRGTQSITTIALLPTGPDVIYMAADGNLRDTILGLAAGSRKTIVLFRNTSYSVGTAAINIPNNVSIRIWGQGGGNKPVIHGATSGSMNMFYLPTAMDSLKFENVVLEGFVNNDQTGTSGKIGYVLNQNVACNVGKVVFDNCVIRNFATTAIRTQSAGPSTIDSLIINNCLAYNTANGYAFIHIDATAGNTNNIKVTNSTIYNLGTTSAAKGIIQHTKVGNSSTVITNCTFNNLQCGTNPIITFGTNATSLTLKNNVIGTTVGKGFVASATSVSGASVNNTYITSDCVFSANAIGGTTGHSGTAAQLFTDPTNTILSNCNFSILSSAGFGGVGVGDPRWNN